MDAWDKSTGFWEALRLLLISCTYCLRRDTSRTERVLLGLRGRPGCLQTAAGSRSGCARWLSGCRGSAQCSCCWGDELRWASSTASRMWDRARGSACTRPSEWSRCGEPDPGATPGPRLGAGQTHVDAQQLRNFGSNLVVFVSHLFSYEFNMSLYICS